MTENLVRDNERLEHIGFGELKLLQAPEEFCYGVDAVLLADFACSFLGTGYVSVDLGTGTGVIPAIMNHKKPAAGITGIEIQAKAAERAGRSMKLNGLQQVIEIINADVSDIRSCEGLCAGCADMVTTNPPYVTKGSGICNGSEAKFIARQETTAGIEEFVVAASWLLREKGHLCMVHRPSRLADIMYFCRKYKLEPKDMRFVSPDSESVPNIVLIHCVKGGGRELNLHKTLCVYDTDRNYTNELMKIYERL